MIIKRFVIFVKLETLKVRTLLRNINQTRRAFSIHEKFDHWQPGSVQNWSIREIK